MEHETGNINTSTKDMVEGCPGPECPSTIISGAEDEYVFKYF